MPSNPKNPPAKQTKEHHRTTIGQAQRAKTRTWIIQCAIRVFAEKGPDAPVIQDFAKAAGLSRSSFYNYFQTTHDLLDAAIETVSDAVTSQLLPVVADEHDPLIRFAMAARIYYGMASHDPIFRTFLSSISRVGTLAIEQTRADLSAAMALGKIRQRDIELAAAITHGIMVFSLRVSTVDHEPVVERGKDVIRAILSALGADVKLIDQAVSKPLPYVTPLSLAV